MALFDGAKGRRFNIGNALLGAFGGPQALAMIQRRREQEAEQAQAAAEAAAREEQIWGLKESGFGNPLIAALSATDASALARSRAEPYSQAPGTTRGLPSLTGGEDQRTTAPINEEQIGAWLDTQDPSGNLRRTYARRQAFPPTPIPEGGGLAGMGDNGPEWLVPPHSVDQPPPAVRPPQPPAAGAPRGQLSVEEINQQADEAIRQGRDPAMVNQRRQQLLQRFGGGAGRSGRVPFSGRGFDPIGTVQSRYGVRPTSGYRTPGHQADLVRQGLTTTRSGSHPRGDGVDWPTPPGMTKQQFIAQIQRDFPGARAIPSNGNSVHVTFPGWGGAPDVSNSRRRYPMGGR